MFAVKKNMISGILVTLLLAIISKYLAVFVPFIGAESLAMILGIILGNTVLNQPTLSSGIKWSEKYPIEIGIALLGLTLTTKSLQNLGLNGIGFIIIQMILTIVIALYLGKKIFRTSKKSAMLMASGNAICGSSAIAAISPEIKASNTERRTAVATVSLVGVVLLIILPIIGPFLVGHNDLLLGALVGGTVQSVGQVVGTASLINPTVVTYATIFKMLRVMLLSVVIIIFSKMVSDKTSKSSEQKSIKEAIKVPWFIIAFVLFIAINSFFHLPALITHSASEVASFFGIINLAGIGLSLKFETIKNSGKRFLSYGLTIGLFQIVLAFLLIKLLY